MEIKIIELLEGNKNDFEGGINILVLEEFHISY